MEAQHAEAPHLRLLQKALGQEVTTRVHGAQVCEEVMEASTILFAKDAIEQLEAAAESVFQQLPIYQVSPEALAECQNLTDLISVGCNHLICSSKGEARKAIQGNAISVNKVKVNNPQANIDFPLLRNKYLLIGNGKQKNYILAIS